jgi:hypothetical protein
MRQSAGPAQGGVSDITCLGDANGFLGSHTGAYEKSFVTELSISAEVITTGV